MEVAFVNPDYDAVQSTLTGYIAQEKARGLESAGVYFRDLRNGPTFSIAADDAYIGASLLKLPILLQYLKEAESDSTFLDRRITARVEANTVNQGLPANQAVAANQLYSIADLLAHMVRYSDNNARSALSSYYLSLHPEAPNLSDMLESIGITNVLSNDQGLHITVRQTASIFRMLYNASYLNPEQSQRALTWLSEATFDDGIALPIPESVVVSNKYGIYNTPNDKELHDCGIVYYPEHPYVLCVMTKGTTLEKLQETIAHISEVVFKEVDARYGTSASASGSPGE